MTAIGMKAAVVEAAQEAFASGNWKPTYHEISVMIAHGPEADPKTATVGPIMERLIRTAMNGVVNQLHELGILAVPVSTTFYLPPTQVSGWGNDGQEPRSLGEAYLCLAKPGKPVTGLVHTKPESFLFKAWRQDRYLVSVACWETEQAKLARDIKNRWLTAGEYDSLTRDSFRARLLN